jgi:hypothetical protein
MRPLALFLLSLFLGLQNLSLTAIGLRHIQVSLRDFDVASVTDRDMRSALSACLRKNLVSFTIIGPAESPARMERDGESLC